MTDTTPQDNRSDGAQSVDVCVVGGGLAGLAAAATAARGGARVLLVDGHPLGGRARVDAVGGFRFNRGPRALYAGGPGQRVLDDLGITLTGGPPPTAGGFGLLDGQLALLPATTMSTLRSSLLGWRGRLGLARSQRLLRLSAGQMDDLQAVSLDQWLADSGLPADTARLVLALVRLSTYIDAPGQLSAAAALGQLRMAIDRGVRYLDGGFGAIASSLAADAEAHGAELRVGAAVQEVDVAPGQPAQIRAAGVTISARIVVLAAGSPTAAAALLPQLSGEVATAGPSATAACLELGLRQPPPRRFIVGIDEPLYFSTHCPPADLAPEGGAVVHVMAYHRPGSPRRSGPDLEATDTDGLTDASGDRARLQQLARQAGVADADIVEERFLANMVVTSTIPTVAGGGLAGRPAVASPARPGVLLAGDWVGPTGLLADAALASGAEAGRAAAATIAREARVPA